MGDRNYNPNQYRPSPFIAQNYGYSQPQQPLSSLFDMGSAQGTSRPMPAYNTGPSYDQRQHSGTNYSPQARRHEERGESLGYQRDSQQYNDDQPPPSYEQSRNDMLLSGSNVKPIKSSPAWNYVQDLREEKPQPNKSSFSQLFDIPGQPKPSQRASDWYSDNYDTSQSYPREPQGRFESYSKFSQNPSMGFSSDYSGRSDNRFSQNYDTSGRQGNNFKQNDNRRSDVKNYGRGRGRGGFRGRGNRQNSDGRGRGRGRDGGGSGGRSTFEDKYKSNQSNTDLNIKGIKSIPEHYGENKNEEKRNEELNKQGRGSEDEGNEEDGSCDGEWEKTDVFCPDQTLVSKYQYYPPSPEELGKMFKDLVIYFFFKIPKNKKEHNPFVVICESFRRSSGYHNLDVEDGYDLNRKDRKFCTLKYQGIMLVRGVGENSNLKEPRVYAGIELINTLAMSCYTLKAKPEYFSVESFKQQQAIGDVPGVYRFAPEDKARDYESALEYLKAVCPLNDQESDDEHMFKLPINDGYKLKCWASKHGFEARVIVKDQWIGISRHRSTQYWRDKILASGSMETNRFILTPPQGIGNYLIPNFDIKEVIPGLKARFLQERKLENVYGPPGVGPDISVAVPPWERKGGKGKGNSGYSRNKNKQYVKKRVRQITALVQQGVPIQETKGFSHLSKNKRKKLRAKLGLS